MHATLVKELFPAETEFINDRPKFEKDFAALYAKDKKTALKKLDDYVTAAFAKVAGLTAKLIAKTAKNTPSAP